MKTIKKFSVVVFDDTCNDASRQFGIYGRGNYDWVRNSLNCGDTDEEPMDSREEAEAVKAEFEKFADENGLCWASFEIEESEIQKAENLKDIVDYYNESEILNMNKIREMIEDVNAIDDCHEPWGVCHTDTHKVIIDSETCEALLMRI